MVLIPLQSAEKKNNQKQTCDSCMWITNERNVLDAYTNYVDATLGLLRQAEDK